MNGKRTRKLVDPRGKAKNKKKDDSEQRESVKMQTFTTSRRDARYVKFECLSTWGRIFGRCALDWIGIDTDNDGYSIRHRNVGRNLSNA